MNKPSRSRAGQVARALRPFLPLGSLRGIYDSGLRHAAARRIRRALRAKHLDLPQAIDEIERRWRGALDGAPTESPIFIFGSGWRCGSTWLQRLVMSSSQALIWGEPFDRSCIVQTMSGQLVPLADAWPPDKWFLGGRSPSALADEWVATLYPPVPLLIDAHRVLFRTLLQGPASERGIPRWGLKEIRLTTAHARYLRLLFPAAKFLFLTRNPFDAYGSYRGAWNPWFERWPEGLTVTARQFGRMWSRLAGDFLDHHAAVGGLLLKYEDLVSQSATIAAVSEYLDLELVPARAARPIRGNPEVKEAVPQLERWLLMTEVRRIGRRLGYV